MAKSKGTEISSDRTARNREFILLSNELRGPPNNKFGGHQCRHLRAFRGSKFGAANKGRRIHDPKEKEEIERRLKEKGYL